MKRFLLITSFALIAAVTAHAQKIEVSVDAASIFDHYTGSAANSSSYIVPTSENGGVVANPYGKKLTFGHGFDAQAQVIVHGFILGVQSGYEILKSNVDITGVQPLLYQVEYTSIAPQNYPTNPAHGSTTLQSNVININPYIGYRINAGLFHIDLTPGVDIGLTTKMTVKGKGTETDNNAVYYVENKSSKPSNDTRLRMGATLGIKRLNIFAAYAHGLTNLNGDAYNGSSHKIHSDMVRIGLGYRLL